MPLPIPAHEPRSRERLREQYLLEKQLASTLRKAPARKRQALYADVYQELAARIPDHPQLYEKQSPAARAHTLGLQEAILTPFIHEESVVFEIGAGDLGLALRLSGKVKQVYALEVSEEMTRGIEIPPNVTLFTENALPFDLPDESVDVVFSCHVIEHLHPDDACEQLREMRRLLVVGGHYICITPNRLYGPHDISRYFEDEPAGLHLKEYTNAELAALFTKAGLSARRILRGVGRRLHIWPVWPCEVLEAFLSMFPTSGRRRILSCLGGTEPFRPLEQVKLLATKK